MDTCHCYDIVSVLLEGVMSEIAKVCKKHGELTLSKVIKSKDRNLKLGYCYKCKLCVYIAAHKRPCKVHGEIQEKDRCPSGQCRICGFEKLRAANQKRNSNRADFNEKQRLKRESNPDKYAKEYKKRHQQQVEKHGQPFLSHAGRAKQKGLTPDDLTRMIQEQNNKCAICMQPESRVYKDRLNGSMRIANLCIDHDHETGIVRDLLCHDCNTALGKFKDDIHLLESAINYLKKHNMAAQDGST